MEADVTVTLRQIFLYQVAVPASLQVLERLIGEELRDVAFLGLRPVRIPGVPADVEIEISRTGMAGTLAYELRGPIEHGPEVFDAVYRAGADFEIARLGWRTYVVNHTEGGFAQQGCNFLPSAHGDPQFATHPAFGLSAPAANAPAANNPSVGLPGSAGPGRLPGPEANPVRGELGMDRKVRPRLHRPCGTGGRSRSATAKDGDSPMEQGGCTRCDRLANRARRGVQALRIPDHPPVARRRTCRPRDA
jgi:hypothetical protein